MLDKPPHPDRTFAKSRHRTIVHVRYLLRDMVHGLFNAFSLAINVIRERSGPNLRVFFDERQPLVWLLALIIGIFVAYFALLFRLLIGVLQLPWLGTMTERVWTAAAETSLFIILLAPAFGGLIVGILLQWVLPNRRALGVADVIEARAIKGCKIPVGAGLGSALVSAVSLGFGASTGREGPVVHLGATIASYLEDQFTLPKSARRTLLACGVAAAVSASFNAPIAGVLFAHEVILTHYAISAFVPIVIASVAGTVIVRIHLGSFPAFIVPDYSITSFWEFPAFALLGLTCAAVAVLFQLSLITTDRVAHNISMPIWVRPVIGGLMIGIIAVFFPQILGVGYDTTDAALNQQLTLELLLALLVVKTAATSISLASRFGGGIFSPTLFLGAMAGGAFGLIAAKAFPEIASSEGLYAMIGMGAVAAAVLGAPFSTTVMVFELTGGYEITIALLLAVSISTGFSQAILGQSFFLWQLSMRGLFLKDGQHKQIVRSIHVRDFFTELTPSEVEQELHTANRENTLKLSDTLELTLRKFDSTGDHRLPVVESEDESRLIGWADHWAALEAMNKALIEVHVEEHH